MIRITARAIRFFALSIPAVLSVGTSARAAQPIWVGSIDEGLSAPMSLAVDADRIGILEPFARQVVVFSTEGYEQRRLDIDASARALAPISASTYVFCDRESGSVRSVDVTTGGMATFVAAAGDPIDLEVGGGRCWILDAQGRVLITDLAGAVQGQFSTIGPDGVVMKGPSSLTRDSATGRIHVLDQATSRVSTYDSEGGLVGGFGSFGADPGQVTRGGEIACDADGWVYVCDRYQGRVAVFDSDGVFSCFIDPLDLGHARLALPTGVEVDANGLVYVASTESRRIQLFWVDKQASPGQLPPAYAVHPADHADIGCDDLRLVASIAVPAEGPRPTGTDFRLFLGADTTVPIAGATNVTPIDGDGGAGAATVTAEWRPEIECASGTSHAWQVRSRIAGEAGAWSPLRWFVTREPAIVFGLGQNYPNPCGLRTVIPFRVPIGGEARLQIFDVQGRVVWGQHLVDLPGGLNEVTWNGRNGAGETVASGVYFYRLDANGEAAIRKLILVR